MVSSSVRTRPGRFDPDALAATLATGGALARMMPPSWDGAKITIPVRSPESGLYLGRALPGRGLYLDLDLKSLGITKPIPDVYEKTGVARVVEALDRYGEMRGHVFDAERRAIRFLDALKVMAGCLVPSCGLSGFDAVLNARLGGKAQDIIFSKVSATSVALSWHSLFLLAGLPATGTVTNITGGAVMTRSNVGALSLGLQNPTAPDRKYLLTLGAASTVSINWFMLVDILVSAANILLTTLAAQTVNTVALTRYISSTTGLPPNAPAGAGVNMIFEITTQASATNHNITVNKYTDQDGNTLSTTGAQTGINGGIVGRLTPTNLGPVTQLASGDYGVRSVEEVTCSAALAAGVICLHLYYPLHLFPGIAANIYVERDAPSQIDGATELTQDGSQVLGCVAMFVLPNTTTTGQVNGFLRTVAG